MTGFWQDLKQRKLVQWVAAYVAAAWALLQLLGLLVDSYDWPHLVMHVGFAVAVLGLAIACVLAWYHGERGEQKVLATELFIVTLVLVIGGGLIWRSNTHLTVDAPASALAISNVRATAKLVEIPDIARDPSIAVLPFVNMSSDKEQEYFSEGISEDLLNLLAKVPKLRVIARTSSFSFKGKEVPIADIARALNVAAILEGSVRKSGNKVRIRVQLIRASDSSQLWSETYDRTLDDIFKVQDQIAASVVAQLQIKLLGAAPTIRPVNPRAYPLILQAKALTDQTSASSLAQALRLYQQALAIAPDEPRAWNGLARVYINGSVYLQRPAAEGSRLAKGALYKALAIDPDDAEAHASLGYAAAQLDGDLATAAQHLQRALTLDPGNLSAVYNAAILLNFLGRVDEAIALDEYDVAHDPANPSAHGDLGLDYYFAGRWDKAIASNRTALDLSPGYLFAHSLLGMALLLGKDDAVGALKEVQAESAENMRMIGLAITLQALGRKPDADAALAALIAKHGNDTAFGVAIVLAYRGEPDRAFEWLEKAVATQDPGLSSITLEPLLSPLHSDPRWLPFLRKIGKAPEQLAKIKFKVSLPQTEGKDAAP